MLIEQQRGIKNAPFLALFNPAYYKNAFPVIVKSL